MPGLKPKLPFWGYAGRECTAKQRAHTSFCRCDESSLTNACRKSQPAGAVRKAQTNPKTKTAGRIWLPRCSPQARIHRADGMDRQTNKRLGDRCLRKWIKRG